MIQSTLCYLERGDEYLMLHRVKKKNDANHDKWIGVGGKFEEGESPEECILRETKEETGLTLTEYRVLLMLIQRGSVVTRSSLLELLWDDGAKFVDDNTLSVHMSRLRDKVGAEHIRTVRGVGYQWVE